MKPRLLLVVLILFIPVSDYVAQENPDPKQAELAIQGLTLAHND